MYGMAEARKELNVGTAREAGRGQAVRLVEVMSAHHSLISSSLL